jgi:hypothetical protein
MYEIKREKIIEIMQEYMRNVSWSTWKKKSSILFSIKSKYGDALNIKNAEAIYDSLTNTEMERRAKK